MSINIFKSISFFVLMVLFSCKSPQPNRAIEGKVKKEVISFSAKLPGRIIEIYVNEGDEVKLGDTLAILDIPEVYAKIQQAKGAKHSAQMQAEMARTGATQNQLKQLRAKQSGLMEQYEFAKKSYERAENMFNDSLMSPQNFDEVYAKYKGAKSQLDAVNAELDEVLKGTRREQIGMAEGQAQQAQGALQEALTAYSERYIVATNDMQIETITLNKGELATPGFALFNGYIPNSTYFRFTIPESEMLNFQKGSEIRMKSTFGGLEFSGKIMTIKQLTKYADITTAFPDYKPEESIYEIKIVPLNLKEVENLLVNSSVQIIE